MITWWSTHVPAAPKQDDVVTWWSSNAHPGGAYVQRHRATYYARATCKEVFGEDYVSGKSFCDEWLIETWYEPSGEKTSGGRTTTENLRRSVPSVFDWSIHATWAEARDAAIARTQALASEHRASAFRLEQKATKLAEAATPPETR